MKIISTLCKIERILWHYNAYICCICHLVLCSSTEARNTTKERKSTGKIPRCKLNNSRVCWYFKQCWRKLAFREYSKLRRVEYILFDSSVFKSLDIPCSVEKIPKILVFCKTLGTIAFPEDLQFIKIRFYSINCVSTKFANFSSYVRITNLKIIVINH